MSWFIKKRICKIEPYVECCIEEEDCSQTLRELGIGLTFSEPTTNIVNFKFFFKQTAGRLNRVITTKRFQPSQYYGYLYQLIPVETNCWFLDPNARPSIKHDTRLSTQYMICDEQVDDSIYGFMDKRFQKVPYLVYLSENTIRSSHLYENVMYITKAGLCDDPFILQLELEECDAKLEEWKALWNTGSISEYKYVQHKSVLEERVKRLYSRIKN